MYLPVLDPLFNLVQHRLAQIYPSKLCAPPGFKIEAILGVSLVTSN